MVIDQTVHFTAVSFRFNTVIIPDSVSGCKLEDICEVKLPKCSRKHCYNHPKHRTWKKGLTKGIGCAIIIKLSGRAQKSADRAVKKSRKGLDKRRNKWYNEKVQSRETENESEPWKLNNANKKRKEAKYELKPLKFKKSNSERKRTASFEKVGIKKLD